MNGRTDDAKTISLRLRRGDNNSMWPASGGFDLGHNAVLETSTFVPLSAADNISRQVGPRSGRTKCFNVFIHNKGFDKNVRYAV